MGTKSGKDCLADLVAYLTHTQRPTNGLSLICCCLGFVPHALALLFTVVLFWRRDAYVLLVGVGQLCCELINFALKQIIKESRPVCVPGLGYGMPSSHAQFVAFWSVTFTAFLTQHPQRVSMENSTGYRHVGCTPWERRSAILVVVATAVMTSWSRIYLNYHTTRQVVVGFGIGVMLALGWLAASSAILMFYETPTL